MGIIKNWSPSRLFEYEVCPQQAKYKAMNLCPKCFQGKMIWVGEEQVCDNCNQGYDSNDAFDRGTRIHAEIAAYITGRSNDLTEDTQNVQGWLALLRQEYKERRVYVEKMAAFTPDWQPCDWKSKAAICRMKIDVLWLFEPRQILVVDWKTGKMKKHGEYADQLNIYSVAALSMGLGDAAQTKLIFTDYDDGEVERPEGTVTLETLPLHQKRWNKRAQAMLTDELFPPRPGKICDWCPFTANNGGPCRY